MGCIPICNLAVRLHSSALSCAMRRRRGREYFLVRPLAQQVRQNVAWAAEAATAAAAAAEEDAAAAEKKMLEILAPVKDATWASGKPENN